MKFIHRLGYYLGGLAVGLVFLAFFLKGKNASCDYGPDARVLKNIRSKSMSYSEGISDKLEQFEIDSTAMQNLLTFSDVNFRKSDVKQDSCSTYFIEGSHRERDVFLTITNCAYKAELIDIDIK